MQLPVCRPQTVAPSRGFVQLQPAQRQRGMTCSAVASEPKTIHFMRHGVTEMNVYLASMHRSKNCTFEDPLYYDTILTKEGTAMATAQRPRVNALQPTPELIVVSGLTRTMQTANLAWRDVDCPRIACPHASERLWHSSDVGRSPSILAEQFPQYQLHELDNMWWFHGGSGDSKRICEEPHAHFVERMRKFTAWLEARPESVIAVVSHWGVLMELTGKSMQNCELVTCTSDDLLLSKHQKAEELAALASV